MTDALDATVAGGISNTASGVAGTVGGGISNTASADHATVGGGISNTASAMHATVAGGASNIASALAATVGGGDSNTASGNHATVPGGSGNQAQGQYSFAAGRRAYAWGDGSFVWADASTPGSDYSGWGANSFAARAVMGFLFDVNNGRNVRIWDDGLNLIETSTGARLTLGGVWTNASDVALKENFTPVDSQAVLANLAEMPITSWNSKAEDASIRHMGPTAQDFYHAFGLGNSDTSIGTIDADGVALAAIQGLYRLSQEQGDRIQALEEENASLNQRLDSLETRVSALEGGAGAGAAVSQASSSGVPALWPVLGGGLALAGLVLVRRLAGARR
jgi:hypothetical protein